MQGAGPRCPLPHARRPVHSSVVVVQCRRRVGIYDNNNNNNKQRERTPRICNIIILLCARVCVSARGDTFVVGGLCELGVG